MPPIITNTLSPWQRHLQRWEHCTKCPLHKHRERVVLARGKLPCDILLIGEAPGQGEDDTGQPFKGPAGRHLDELIAAARRATNSQARLAFTNIIACIPLDEELEKTEDPPDFAVEACAPRLEEFIKKVARPKLIVAIGRYAKKNVQGAWIDLIHPAAILRMKTEAQKDIERKRVVARMIDVFNELRIR